MTWLIAAASLVLTLLGLGMYLPKRIPIEERLGGLTLIFLGGSTGFGLVFFLLMERFL